MNGSHEEKGSSAGMPLSDGDDIKKGVKLTGAETHVSVGLHIAWYCTVGGRRASFYHEFGSYLGFLISCRVRYFCS